MRREKEGSANRRGTSSSGYNQDRGYASSTNY